MPDEIITMMTTDPYIHYHFMYSLCQNVKDNGKIPIVLLPYNEDMYGKNFPFSRVVINYLYEGVFKVLKPIAHIQMQDHDVPHRTAITRAKLEGVKTFVVQHGLSSNVPYILGDSAADYMFVWSQREKDKIGEFYPKEQIIVTGNPRYDYVQKSDIVSQNVLFATNMYKSTDGEVLGVTETRVVEFVEKFLALVKAHPEKNYYIKCHPSSYDEPKFYVEILRKHKMSDANIYIVDKNADIFRVMESMSCVITFPYSTISADAPAYGLPVIDIGEDFDLVDEFERVMRGETPRSDQHDDIPKDKKSGERIIKFILSAIQ